MIIEVRKSLAAARLFRNFIKTSVISQSHNFMQPVRCVAIYDRRIITESPKILQTSTVFSAQQVLKNFSSEKVSEKPLDKITFESVCSETLDSLSEYFEELVETIPSLKNADVMYSDGVLTVNLGKSFGTYVINRQTPNLQIWLSSPTSGPKRYDFVDGTWIYKHDKTTLHSLLDKEIKEIVDEEVHFVEKCLHAKASAKEA